jgi:hypothetical protein
MSHVPEIVQFKVGAAEKETCGAGRAGQTYLSVSPVPDFGQFGIGAVGKGRAGLGGPTKLLKCLARPQFRAIWIWGCREGTCGAGRAVQPFSSVSNAPDFGQFGFGAAEKKRGFVILWARCCCSACATLVPRVHAFLLVGLRSFKTPNCVHVCVDLILILSTLARQASESVCEHVCADHSGSPL